MEPPKINSKMAKMAKYKPSSRGFWNFDTIALGGQLKTISKFQKNLRSSKINAKMTKYKPSLKTLWRRFDTIALGGQLNTTSKFQKNLRPPKINTN